MAASSSSTSRHWIGSSSSSKTSFKAAATSASICRSSCSVTVITYPVLHGGGSAQLFETTLSRWSEGPDGPIQEFAGLFVGERRIREDEHRQQLSTVLVEGCECPPYGAARLGSHELALVLAVARACGAQQATE